MNVQVFALETLKKIYSGAKDKQDFEHPSSLIYKSNKFNVKYIDPNNQELIWPGLSLTVDTIKEYEFVKIIYEYFGHNNFTLEDIIRYLKYSKTIK
jgi:spore coat polysaccharide biosynthesis protein SpsF (cytidylyltransferase family)